MCVFYVEHVQYVIVFPVPATCSGSGQCLRFFWLAQSLALDLMTQTM